MNFATGVTQRKIGGKMSKKEKQEKRID